MMPKSTDALNESRMFNFDNEKTNKAIGNIFDPGTGTVGKIAEWTGNKKIAEATNYAQQKGMAGAASGFMSGGWVGAIVGGVAGVITGVMTWNSASREDEKNRRNARNYYLKQVEGYQRQMAEKDAYESARASTINRNLRNKQQQDEAEKKKTENVETARRLNNTRAGMAKALSAMSNSRKSNVQRRLKVS
jgi:type II secretory pathway pseudopilin PulG